MVQPEQHYGGRATWLRAAVLGANDGLISTASLVVGVASAKSSHEAVLLAALAGMAAGALSMAAGEFVSVSSQADTEKADLAKERIELAQNPAAERAELASIYVDRGLPAPLASQVVEHLMAHDALGAHARDELGITDKSRARPLQAALASASAFASGAFPPLLSAMILPRSALIPGIAGSSLVLLVILGATAAHLGGASLVKGAARVTFWGAVAMGVTALVGRLFGAAA